MRTWLGVVCVAFLAHGDELPRRPFLGVALEPIPGDAGARIREVLPNSSAEAGGLKPGDVLKSAQDVEVRQPSDFLRVVAKNRDSGSIKIRFDRGGKEVDLQIALRPMPRETSSEFEIIYDSVATEDGRRRTIITRPRGEGPFPAVLLAGGIGCYSIDEPLRQGAYTQLFYELTRQGFATMRVEKTGMGDSTGKPCPDADLNDEVAGLKAGLEMLRKQAFVDRTKVFIFGHSLGGITAPMLAKEGPLRGMVVMATVATSWFEYEVANHRRQMLLTGATAREVDESTRRKTVCAYGFLLEQAAPRETAATC